MAHYCPICRLVKIQRREVRTCGSAGCLEVWKSWTPAQKAKALEAGDVEAEKLSENLANVTTDRLSAWLGKKGEVGKGTASPLVEILGEEKKEPKD